MILNVVDFEMELYTNDEHVIVRMYKLLLTFETRQVKECIVKSAKMLVIIHRWNNGEISGWKNWNIQYVIILKTTFIKWHTIVIWHGGKLSRMFKATSNLCWKCE